MAEQKRTYLIDRFQDGAIPDGQDFADMIDSSLNLLDDGLTSYKISDTHGEHKRFGIGDTSPAFPLSIQAEDGHDEGIISFISADGSQKWNINLNPSVSDVPGFSIDNYSTSSGISRFFIKEEDGKIGFGTVSPLQQMHIAGAADGDILAVQIENISTGHLGWLLGHIDDNAILERSGAFAVLENVVDPETGVQTTNERMTFLKRLGDPNSYNNIGINEKLPFATLHVTRIDTDSDVRLDENTGILLLGAIDSANLAFDSQSIQGRTGEYISSTLSFVASDLNLQPLGGNIIVHSNYLESQQIQITDDGLVGLGKVPVERLDVNGAVTFGDTETLEPAEGTVRWHITDPATGTGDLQLFKDEEWKSLTEFIVSDGLWKQGAPGVIFYDPNNAEPKVGINIAEPASVLHVVESNPNFIGSTNAALTITNSGRTSQELVGMIRSGLQISTSGVFSTDESALNVGLYVSSTNGQSNANGNLGALINGSVVIGGATGLPVIGTNGTNVLAIQNGAAPTEHAGGGGMEAGIQIYSTVLTGGNASVFNVMNGDGTVIQLFQQFALPAEDWNKPNTSDVNTDMLINNMRERIDALEIRLQALGLIL
ncbi:MAG: hypothetical protein ABIQ40_19935 [Bacteroidia bacterium]